MFSIMDNASRSVGSNSTVAPSTQSNNKKATPASKTAQRMARQGGGLVLHQIYEYRRSLRIKPMLAPTSKDSLCWYGKQKYSIWIIRHVLSFAQLTGNEALSDTPYIRFG